MIRLGFLVLATLLLVRCQNFSTHPTNSDILSNKSLTFSFASSRRLELKPCGCTTRPLGGLSREWNALKDYHPYSFSAGTSFFNSSELTYPVKLTAEKKSTLINKTKTFFAALEKLNTLAISVSYEDMALGIETLQEFKKLTKIPLVASNLTNNNPAQEDLIFSKYVELTVDGTQILVLSFTEGLPHFPEINQFRVTPPEDALKKHLSSKADLVIILSNLPMVKVKKLSALLKKPHLFLGGAELEHSPYIDQISNKGLVINPIPSGRAVGVITLETGHNSNDVLYNEDIFYEVAVKRNRWKEHAKKNKEDLKLTDKMNFDFKFTKIPYSAKTIELEPDFDTPDNPIHKILADYNKTLQDRALNELDQ